MPQVFKNVSAVVKATDGEPGEFEAVVAVFGNVDVQGDIVDKGAFKQTLGEWVAKGQPVPIIWSHNWDDPFAHIGGFDPAKAKETDEGLVVKGVLDTADNPTAAQVYRLMKAGRVNQFSFAADTYDGGWSITEEDDRLVQHLTSLDLIEVGPTLRGANPETHIMSIKSDRPRLKGDTAAPRVPVQKAAADSDEDPVALAQAIDAVLDQAAALLVDVDTSGLPEPVQQCLALLPAVLATVDNLLEVLGAADVDDLGGVTLAGAAPGVKKSGRVLAQKHVDTLEGVHKTLGDLIATVKASSGDTEDDAAKAAPAPTLTKRQQLTASLGTIAVPAN